MIETSPAQCARMLFEAMNARDTAAFLPLLAEDAVFDFPGTPVIRGAERIGRFLKILFHKYPTLVFEVGRVVADDSRAAVEWTNAGEARDGAPYRNAGATFLEMRGNLIVYLSDTFKDTSLFVRAPRQP